MAKKRSPATDYLVYLLVRFAVCVIQMLSWRAALKLAEWLARLAYRLDRRHRLVADENLRHAFPGLDESARDALVRATYQHFATMVVEMIRLPRVLHRTNLATYVRFASAADHELVLNWMRSDRPRLILTGHFGNWELLSYVTGLFGCRGAIVARRLDNPHVDRFLEHHRCNTGLELVDKNTDYLRILDIMAAGDGLGMVGDQDAGQRGLFVSFFNRPASTFKSIALLSLEYRASILVMGAVRVGHPMQYQISFEDVILPEDYAGRADAARAITQRYTDALERMVRRHPEQYFWLHRRWKHQPLPRKAKAAA